MFETQSKSQYRRAAGLSHTSLISIESHSTLWAKFGAAAPLTHSAEVGFLAMLLGSAFMIL